MAHEIMSKPWGQHWRHDAAPYQLPAGWRYAKREIKIGFCDAFRTIESTLYECRAGREVLQSAMSVECPLQNRHLFTDFIADMKVSIAETSCDFDC